VCVRGSRYDIQGGGAGRPEGASKDAFRVLGCGCRVLGCGFRVSGLLSVCVGSKYDIQGGAGRPEGVSKYAFRVLGCGCRLRV